MKKFRSFCWIVVETIPGTKLKRSDMADLPRHNPKIDLTEVSFIKR
ncbi:hypothetical protein LEP1GSC179_0543 [Leptospira santarosai str. MOR084]|uniref:Uncharacterized protein n=1 Tax=Leptospira santarosai str. MOR084 TaxID=1049984 RepID=A0A0E2BA50_9LEPT|nr:hypothetical protein LEP1GSC179_0543 [Leptospira santarosai str. MOR084]